MPRIGPGLPVDQNNPDPGLDMERASDAFIKVPLILGVSTTESNLDFNANDIQFGFEEDHRNRILRTFIRNAYVYHLNEIFSAVRNEYTDWDKPVLHPIIIRDSTMEALSDGHTVAPLMRIAFYHARRGAKTYFYHFNHQSKDNGYLQVGGWIRLDHSEISISPVTCNLFRPPYVLKTRRGFLVFSFLFPSRAVREFNAGLSRFFLSLLYNESAFLNDPDPLFRTHLSARQCRRFAQV